MFKTRLGPLGILLVILLVIVGTIYYLTRTQPVEVLVRPVSRGVVEATVANTRSGTVKARQRANLAPAIGGQVARLLVTEGDRVEQDEMLLELWNEDLVAEVALAESEIGAARARHEEACELAQVADRRSDRLIKLQADGLANEEELDEAASEARARRAVCRATEATIHVHESRLRVAEARLERTRLKAPFSGVVAEVNAELGEYVTPSPPGIPTLPALDLIDDGTLYVLAPIDEVDAPKIRTKLSVRVTLDAYPGKNFSGTVSRVAPYVLDLEKQARTVDVEVDLDTTEEVKRFLVGYSADAEIILERHENVLRVPTEAVLEGFRVLVYRRDDGRLEERQIEPGTSNWSFTEVLSGLQEGELVVTSVEREGVVAGARALPQNSTDTANGGGESGP